MKLSCHDSVACHTYFGSRGLVTATKHFGLESLRVRKCDPDADDADLLDRAPQRWNHDLEFDSKTPSTGLCAHGWQCPAWHDRQQRPPSIDAAERTQIDRNRLENTEAGCRRIGLPGSDRDQCLDRSCSLTIADWGSIESRETTRFVPSIYASGVISPLCSVSVPNLFREGLRRTSPAIDANRRICLRQMTTGMPGTSTHCGQRTHSLLRVSDEKRNVDECPATRGKSNRHR